MTSNTPCRCGENVAYELCCGKYINGQRKVPTAALLMRSRFTAFAAKHEAYLLDSWDTSTRPEKIDFSKDTTEWQRLEIVMTKKGLPGDSKGMVEFKAFYLLNGEEHVLNEISRFRKMKGAWYYLDGKVKSITKVGMQISQGKNAPCSCGSGKKFKRCCGKD